MSITHYNDGWRDSDRRQAIEYQRISGISYRNHTGYERSKAFKTLGDTITKVIFNNPATIVIWGDGSKTVVKASKNECFDPEKGLAMAIAKHALGNKGNYYNEFKKWLPEESTLETNANMYVFYDYMFHSTEEVQTVLSYMKKHIQEYGYATVADLYDLVGLAGSYAETTKRCKRELYTLGWTSLNAAYVTMHRGGYRLVLPKAAYLCK